MWRNTAFPVRIWLLDARACFPLLVFVLYWSWTTAYIALAGITFFTIVTWCGLTVPTMLRLLRRKLVGPVSPAVPAWKRRRLA
jgi:intracellular multiplication protein IcmT